MINQLSLHLNKFISAVLAAIFLWSALPAAGWAVEAAPASCIWYAGADTAYQLRASDQLVLRKVHVAGVARIAMAGDCGAYLLTKTSLVKLDDAGALLFERDWAGLGSKLVNPDQVAADPYDGSVWIGDTANLMRLNARGEPLSSARAPGPFRSMVLGADHTLWLLGNKVLWQIGQSGQLLATRSLSGMADVPKLLAVDSLGSALWLAGEKKVARIVLPAEAGNDTWLSLPAVAQALAVDPQSGTAWVLAGERLLAFDRDGKALRELDLAGAGLTKATQLAFDPITQSLWLATDDKLARLDVGGAIVAVGRLEEAVAGLAAPGFRLQPALTLARPASGGVSNIVQPVIAYQLDARCNQQPCAPAAAQLAGLELDARLNGKPIGPFVLDGASREWRYLPAERLPEGLNELAAQAKDRFGNTSAQVSDRFTIDTVPPVFVALSPASGSVLTTDQAVIEGVLDDAKASVVLDRTDAVAQVEVNDSALHFAFRVKLAPGQNAFQLSAVDQAANLATRSLLLSFAPPPPTAPVAALVKVEQGGAGLATVTGQAGAVAANAQVSVINGRTAQQVLGNADAAGAFSLSIAAASGDTLSVTVRNSWGASSDAITLKLASAKPVDPTAVEGIVPPDPASLAPPNPPGVATRLGDSAAFLFSGANAIQTGVAAGTIEPRRIAVIRGQVSGRDGKPMPAVRVRVLDHPELGQTFTRADGRYDLAVNGGARLTLQFDKVGVLPAQRQVQTPWRDYVAAPEVALVELDDKATAVALAGAQQMQVAQGSLVSDRDGLRQVTALFPAGTAARMRLPDGSEVALPSITFRATEYTVGPNGMKAMPGPLPPMSGYTYAVELSVDEAIAAGASSVQFSQPLPLYVDNFINFPVGTVTPVGYYDRARGAWVPSLNGRVIKVLSVAAGVAALDLNGSGNPADAAQLSSLGIGLEEQQQIARLFQPGKTLTRFVLTHFTPIDLNHPVGPPKGAASPTGCDQAGRCTEAEQEREDKPKDECGSIIECENQVLGERLAVAGTPFSLNYRSNRADGYRATRRIHVPVTGAVPPANVLRIETTIQIAGREIRQEYPSQPNQVLEFEWDGKDAYGREVVGRAAAKVTTAYVYAPVYYRSNEEVTASFNTVSGAALAVDVPRGEVRLERSVTVILSAGNGIGPNSVAGWTLNVHHIYDPVGSSFLFGDGSTFQPKSALATSITPNTSARALAINAAGTIYSTGSFGRKISMDGSISPIFSGNADLTTLAADEQGSLYYPVYLFGRATLIRMAPDGTRTAIAGEGPSIPADQKKSIRPQALAVDRDGSIYFSELDGVSGNYYVERCQVRKLSVDGTISRVAGEGSCYRGQAGDGGPALAASLHKPGSLALDSGGNLYVADAQVVRKVSPDGLISTVAGTVDPVAAGCSAEAASPDGVAATQFCLGTVQGIAIDRNDQLVITASTYMNALGHRRSAVLRVNGDGSITTLAAANGAGCTINNEALDQVSSPRGICSDSSFGAIAVNADNDIVVSFADRLLYIGPKRTRCVNEQGVLALQCDGVVGTSEKAFASSDGTEVYVIDQAGRHVRTLNARTKAIVYAFQYDGAGRIVSVKDGDGNLTVIERDAGGAPVAVVSPYGQRSSLLADASGRLVSMSNPNGETYRMTYDAGGLLQRFETPRKTASTFSYDALGRLAQDSNAGGGFWSLSRSASGAGSATVTLTSAMGRSKSNFTENRGNGDQLRIATDADGTQTRTLLAGDKTTVSNPDGTVVTTSAAADPRFGMQVPYNASVSVKLPSGLTYFSKTERKVALNVGSDPLSLLSATETSTVNGRLFKTEYDALKRQYTWTSPLNRTTTTTTDDKGRILAEQRGALEAIRYAYDAHGRLLAASQGSGDQERSNKIAYDAEGNVAALTDALNLTTTYRYDPAGRVIAMGMPNGRVISYGYDANGNLASVTPPGRPQYAYAYNAVDLAEAALAPAVEGAGAATRYEYNLDKQLVKVVRPDGSATGYYYDEGGRLSRVATPSGDTSYGYAGGSGQLASVTKGGLRLSFEYDGSLATATHFDGPVSGNVTTAYDEFLRVKRLGVNGAEVEYSYDNDGLLIGAGALAFNRDAANGLLAGASLGVVTSAYAHDGFGQLTAASSKVGADELFAEELVRDNSGRPLQKTERIQGQVSVFSYRYDAAGHLTLVTRNGAEIGRYAYDDNGNRTMAYGLSAVYDEQDRLTQMGDGHYSYTANGELSAFQAGSATTRYAYDGYGTLNRVELPDGKQIEYLADGLSRRVGKKVDGVLAQAFLYQDQLRPAAELDGNGAVVARFVYGAHSNVPEYMVKSGITYRLLLDGLGSVRMVLDAGTGAVAQRIDYDAWGNVEYDSNPGFQPFGFAGGLYDRDTGLVRFGARDYDPRAGRWTSKDALGFGGGDTSLYGYVGGNPVGYTDPKGQFLHIGIGAVIGAIAGGLGAAQNPCATTKQIVLAAMGGAVAGAIGAAVPVAGSLAQAAMVGGEAGFFGNAIGQVIGNGGFEGFNPAQAVMQGAVGAVGGAIGNAVGLATGLGAVARGMSSGQAIRQSGEIGTTAAIGASVAANAGIPTGMGGMRGGGGGQADCGCK